jgi:hypothetical protein
MIPIFNAPNGDEAKRLRLEDNFNVWLLQARKDFQHLTSTTDAKFLCEQIYWSKAR